MLRSLIAAALTLAALSSVAEARQRPAHHSPAPICDNKDVMRPCGYHPNFLEGVRSIDVKMRRVSSRVVEGVATKVADVATQMLPHPAGCPRTAFCGCGAAQEVGRGDDRSLWLAANWSKFPASSPAPGMAAYRSGHVFVLRQHVEGNVWLVADHNSGGHLSRLHPRSISGYRVVDPHA